MKGGVKSRQPLSKGGFTDQVRWKRRSTRWGTLCTSLSFLSCLKRRV